MRLIEPELLKKTFSTLKHHSERMYIRVCLGGKDSNDISKNQSSALRKRGSEEFK
jgi:hypothetical protein